ncbi:MAG: transcription antitermination protein NusB [Muribaculaceae bacterium]|nr:transcription antitermination protein NusB [Muribaculaceae bacterium]
MINRVLIRIKVVQLLYSYLLTNGEFKMRTPQADASAAKTFAYRAYRYMLFNIMRLSGGGGLPQLHVPSEISLNKYLKANKVSKIMLADSDLRGAVARDEEYPAQVSDSLILDIYNEIVNSAAYRSYVHTRNKDLGTDVKFWSTILTTVMSRNQAFKAMLRNLEGYSLRGEEEALEMAVASIDELAMNSMSLINARRQLRESLDKAYLLYNALLQLPVEITRLEEMRIDNARNKYLATSEDLNPNLRFVDNKLVAMLASSEEMADYFKENPFSWADDTAMLSSMLEAIKNTEEYAQYMQAESTSLKDDCEFWRTMFRKVILPGDDLAEVMESKSVYWNDDLDIIGTFVTKTIRRIADKQEGEPLLLPQYKDEEDAAFGNDLFMLCVDNYDLYRSYIDTYLDQRTWESDRLAFMDVVIMIATLAEIINYPAIPIAVSINEYIEIAHYYSTPRSGQFINGLLYVIIEHLKQEGKITK